MTLKDKMKTYNFWISIASAAVLIVRIIGEKFNFSVDATLIMDITTGLCSIFVICGILSVPKGKNTNTTIQSATKESLTNVSDIIENITNTQTTMPTPSQTVLDKVQEIEDSLQSSSSMELNSEIPDIDNLNQIDSSSKITIDKPEDDKIDIDAIEIMESTFEDTNEPKEEGISPTDEEPELIYEQTNNQDNQTVNKEDLGLVVENLKKAIYDASKILETINNL